MRVEQIAQDSGFSSLLYRMHLTGDGVPPTLIAKLPAESEARGAMEMLGGYRRELAFYRDVAGRAPMETPQVYAARMVDGTADFVLLLEDLQHWDNADHLAGLSMDRARLCIDALAGLHAWSTDSANAAALEDFPSIDTPIARDLLVPAFGPGWQVYLDKSSAPVPAAVAEFAERFAELAAEALQALTERDDAAARRHQGGQHVLRRRRSSRWSTSSSRRAGAGAADIAYLVSQGLPTEVRRGHDEALVARVPRPPEPRTASRDYSFDEAWRHYRFAVGVLDGAAGDHAATVGTRCRNDRGSSALTLTDRAVADHRRDRRTGGVRVTRSAREVVELYNLVVWNKRDFDLAEELMGDTRDPPRGRRGDTP